MGKGVGDSVRLTSTSFRIVGIYETGSAFEDGGGVISLEDAQELLGRLRQVNMFYIKLKEPQYQERVVNRAVRLWPDYQMVTSRELSDQQVMGDTMNVYVAVLGGIAILIGGVGMTNSQLMAVYERTREIGVLRAVGWSSKRVLIMIMEETLIVSLLGGIFGILLGMLGIKSMEMYLVAFGGTVNNVSIGLMAKAMLIVVLLGLVGGLYPAWRASRLTPIEALRRRRRAAVRSNVCRWRDAVQRFMPAHTARAGPGDDRHHHRLHHILPGHHGCNAGDVR